MKSYNAICWSINNLLHLHFVIQTRMRKVLIFSVVALCVYSCTQDRMPDLITMDLELESLISRSAPDNQGLEFYILPDETALADIPQDLENNPLTPEKVELGKFLFFETGFATNATYPSGMGTYSCASCHVPEAGFKSGNFQGIADGGVGFGINGEDRRSSPDYEHNELDVQAARPLSLLNVAFVQNTTWNGRFGDTGPNEGTEAFWKERDGTIHNGDGFASIETQNFEGLETHRIHITKELIDEFGYTELFDDSFPDLSEADRYSNHGGSLAISAYIRTLLSNRAPFQNWLKGDRDALSREEKLGGILFFGKANCSNCHFNQNLGSEEFHALGVKDISDRSFYKTTDAEVLDRNLGRGSFTGDPMDNYRFKVPQVYNVGDAPFYFHGSSARELSDLIDYKNLAVTENDRIQQQQLSEKFIPLNLTELEKSQLQLFLEKSLRDPDLTRYKPTELKSGNCFPNNDPRSRDDLGCN